VHSIALIFVAGGRQATFEIDAWGQHLAGIQQIAGRSIRDNPTRVNNQTLINDRQYTAMVSVRKDKIEVSLNGKLLATHRSNGSDLRLLDLWRLSDSKSLGVGAWDSSTTFHSIEVRSGSGLPMVASKRPNSKSKKSTKSNTPSTPSRKNSKKSSPTSRQRTGNNGRVLIVIANEGFFYREYNDPREELERAGFKVDIAAARKSACRPHGNSGQTGSGIVQPDLAITSADASRYDAIVFSGGWGSSMYQYAFKGSYNNRAYNGDRRTKDAANKLINDFVKQDKYVAGICHGVSVLAWSRINGKSLLEGRRVTAPTRSGPAGIYNGRRSQPSSRWNSEVNGARLTPRPDQSETPAARRTTWSLTTRF